MSDHVRVTKIPVDQVHFHTHNVRRDLGDLRGLAASIKRFGVMQPIVVEDYGDTLRLRAGHRRLAAARMAGLKRIPALIHDEALDDEDWLIQSVQENVMRRELDQEERARAVDALRDLGCTWEGIGEAFGVSAKTARFWSTHKPGPEPKTEQVDYDQAQVMQKIHEGRSIRQAALDLGLNPKTVHRLVERDRKQNGTPLRAPSRKGKVGSHVIAKRALREVCTAWRDAGTDATVTNLLDALERLTETGKAADAMPDQLSARRKRRTS